MLASVATLALFAAACGGPRVVVTTDPRDAILTTDGHHVPSVIDVPVPYHGVMELCAAPPPPASPTPASVATPPLGSRRARLSTPAPVTAWIFPFDFVIELARLPFVDDPVYRARLALPERTDVPVPGFPALGVEDLVRRAEAAAIAR